jgi:hypothetical protein
VFSNSKLHDIAITIIGSKGAKLKEERKVARAAVEPTRKLGVKCLRLVRCFLVGISKPS